MEKTKEAALVEAQDVVEHAQHELSRIRALELEAQHLRRRVEEQYDSYRKVCLDLSAKQEEVETAKQGIDIAELRVRVLLAAIA